MSFCLSRHTVSTNAIFMIILVASLRENFTAAFSSSSSFSSSRSPSSFVLTRFSSENSDFAEIHENNSVKTQDRCSGASVTSNAPIQTRNRLLQQPLHSRRNALAVAGSTATAAFLSVFLPQQRAEALGQDSLFKPNPLTNKVLEKVRVWDQEVADNIKYDDELAPGTPIFAAQYVKLLVPILSIERTLVSVDSLIHQPNGTGLVKAQTTLQKSNSLQTKEFKRIFNAFADNVYYTDPDRANLYLGGGAVPKNEQSLAYLLRNDILTNLDALQAEVSYLVDQRAKLAAGKQVDLEDLDEGDLWKYSKACVEGMQKYLGLVPPGELAKARDLLAESAGDK